MRPLLAVLFLLLLPGALVAPVASAQNLDVYDFNVDFADGGGVVVVEPTGATGSAVVELSFKDLSRDHPMALVPAGEPGDVRVLPHDVYVTAKIQSEDATGWRVVPLDTYFDSGAGHEQTIRVKAEFTPRAVNPFLTANVTVTMIPRAQPDVVEVRTVFVNFFTPGLAGFQILSQGSLNIAPSEVQSAAIKITNAATLPRQFAFEILENPCGLYMVPPAQAVLGPKENKVVRFSVEAPEDKFWYYSEQCSFRIGAYAVDNPDLVQATSVSAVVDGFYVKAEWVFTVVAAAIVGLIVFLVVKRRKEILEEELLGKPQKPWNIPVEAVYLQHLRAKDRRAWYVVRHFLMEEEHRSAMLWYKHQKQATKGRDQKERLILKAERQYRRWKARWAKRIAKPERKADRFEAKLQRRLDRKAKASHKKALKRHKAVVQKQEKAYKAQVERATQRWEKQRAKAEKKGLAVPPRPVVPEPEIDDPPQLQPIPLADHRWNKKAERARRKAVRKRGDLEVRFEKADARHLMKVRRKVRRLARKIDDPDFVKEHPLLHEGANA